MIQESIKLLTSGYFDLERESESEEYKATKATTGSEHKKTHHVKKRPVYLVAAGERLKILK